MLPSPPPEPPPPGAADGAPRGAVVVTRVFAALARLQAERPFAVLAAALFTTLLAGLFAAQLTLKTSLGELLPENKESVIIAEQVKQRLVSSSTLYIVAESRDTAALKRFVDALAPALRALPPGVIGAVDDGVRDAMRFFEQNQLLYAPLEDVQKVHDEILERYEAEVSKAAGFDLGLDDDAPEPAAASRGLGQTQTAPVGDPESQASTQRAVLNADDIRRRIEERKRDALTSKFPDGYYLSPAGDLIVVVVRTPVSAGDVDGTHALLTRIRGLIDGLGPTRFAPDMQVNFSGNLITSMEEYAQIKGDLTHVGAVGVGMILAVVFLFYLRLRPLIAMAVSVGVGVVWTFGAAWLLIGHLNSSTGFLTSIIVGNGINFGIIYMTRYFEVRSGLDARRAVLAAHLDTWRATLAAAGAASVAYGSLVVTDFRGFKHFGVIGGTGMILCWLATTLFLPSILVAFERMFGAAYGPVLPGATRAGAAIARVMGKLEGLRGAYGRPFAFLAARYPRAILAAAAVSALASIAVTAHYVASDPMEYNMRNTRTQPKVGATIARQLVPRVESITGRGQDGLAILVDRLDQVRPLRAALEAKRAAAPPDRKPFERVADIFDLLPQDQEKKIELIEEARDRLERAHRRGMIADADWAELTRYIPAGKLRPIGVDELPEQVARLFVEKDGTRGRLVYIVPTTGRSVWDGHYLLEWADSFRRTSLPDGSVIRGSGNAVIFADLLIAVVEDAPKAIVVSLAATLAIILLTFRGAHARIAVLGTLALGVLWMLAALALKDMKVSLAPGGLPAVELVGLKLNFLNFISLPITIGVGADYAINIVQRYSIERALGVREIVLSTGGAVILCSLTTTLGYLGLTFSINLATVSFGYSAAAGEVSCLVAAVLVLPAYLGWRDRRRASRGAPSPVPRGPARAESAG